MRPLNAPFISPSLVFISGGFVCIEHFQCSSGKAVGSGSLTLGNYFKSPMGCSAARMAGDCLWGKESQLLTVTGLNQGLCFVDEKKRKDCPAGFLRKFRTMMVRIQRCALDVLVLIDD